MKPIYKILLVIAITLLVGVGIYLGWQKIIAPPKTVPEEEAKTAPAAASISPPVAAGLIQQKSKQLIKLSDQAVFDYWILGDTQETYYLTKEGKVWNSKIGEDLAVSGQAINALNFIEPGPKDQKILAAFGDPFSPQWGIFDVIDKVWRPLPAGIQTATWGEREDKLIAILKNANEFNLVEIDLLKNPPSYKVFLRDFRLKDVKLSWRAPKSIMVTEKPAASYAGRVWEFNLDKLSVYLLHAADFGLMIKSTRGAPFIFKFASPDRFSVLNQGFQEVTPVFFTTLPEKCDARDDLIYCFAPEEIPETIELPDDYLQNKFYSIDDLFAVNPKSGAIDELAKSNTDVFPAIDAKNVRYSNGSLFFINRYDNLLYELKLGGA